MCTAPRTLEGRILWESTRSSPAPSPLANPLTPSWCAPSVGAATNVARPAATPFAADFNPLDVASY